MHPATLIYKHNQITPKHKCCTVGMHAYDIFYNPRDLRQTISEKGSYVMSMPFIPTLTATL